MDNNIYILIIILLTILIIFYGGHYNFELIEYDTNYFSSLNVIKIYESKLQSLNIKFDDYIDVTNQIKLTDIIIPNLIKIFLLKIKPFSFFNINKLIDNLNKKSIIMIIFNHNSHNNIELLIKNKNNIGYFYSLDKQISLTGFFNIYNNSEELINLTIFLIKKPFWFY